MERRISFVNPGNAWRFMRECGASGISAGYPALVAPWTVRVIAEADDARIGALAVECDGAEASADLLERPARLLLVAAIMRERFGDERVLREVKATIGGAPAAVREDGAGAGTRIWSACDAALGFLRDAGRRKARSRATI